MSFYRLGLRAAQQNLRQHQLQQPAFRAFVRRLTTEEMPAGGKKLVGAADNAFNRERAAVKAHAAATSGQ